MNNSPKKLIKVQEWVVRFDGKIKHKEEFIAKEEYHKKLN